MKLVFQMKMEEKVLVLLFPMYHEVAQSVIFLSLLVDQKLYFDVVAEFVELWLYEYKRLSAKKDKGE